MGSSRSNKTPWWLVLPILVIACAVAVASEDADTATLPELTIPQGTLRGINLATRFNSQIYGFKGIPFAEPPVGDLRFKAPVAPSPWDGVLDASSESSNCVQSNGQGVEDCLYLNVFTPRLPTSEDDTLLPVMMFVHGGGFSTGSNNGNEYGPEYLLDKDVILVVPSYRLGIFGFLSTGDEVVPGNNGMKDLVRALEWIRENIAHFGGDASQTTLFGQSAGGIATHLLALSPLTDGLIKRYISESGTALSYDGFRPRSVLADRAIQVGEYLGCPTDSSTELVECLRGVTPAELINTNSIFLVWDRYPNVIWSPTAEPDIEGAFLTDDPANIVTAGEFRELEFLTSVNRDEGINHVAKFYQDTDLFDDFMANIETALPVWFTYDTRVEDVAAYTAALKAFYLNDLTASYDVLLANLTNLMTDAFCGYPSYRALQGQLPHLQKPQFLASFEYRGTFTYSNAGGASEVAHGDEMIYFFPAERSFPDSSLKTAGDWEMTDTMVQLWTSFAISGTPTTDNAVIWERYSSLNNYLEIGNYSDTSLTLQYRYHEERMRFWDELTASATWL